MTHNTTEIMCAECQAFSTDGGSISTGEFICRVCLELSGE